jgi:hypothetical protein
MPNHGKSRRGVSCLYYGTQLQRLRKNEAIAWVKKGTHQFSILRQRSCAAKQLHPVRAPKFASPRFRLLGALPQGGPPSYDTRKLLTGWVSPTLKRGGRYADISHPGPGMSSNYQFCSKRPNSFSYRQLSSECGRRLDPARTEKS